MKKTLEEYMDGIVEAEKAGQISYHTTDGEIEPNFSAIDASQHRQKKLSFVEWDLFGYLPKEHGWLRGNDLHSANTREIEDAIREMLQEQQEFLPTNPNILVLGQGIGLECKNLKTLFPQSQIESIGLSPINPQIAIKQTTGNCRQELATALEADFFEEMEVPITNRQYIGYFLDIHTLPPKKFDIIYERFGPIYYSLQYGKARNKKEAQEKFRQIIKKTYDCLAPNGIMIITNPIDRVVVRKALEGTGMTYKELFEQTLQELSNQKFRIEEVYEENMLLIGNPNHPLFSNLTPFMCTKKSPQAQEQEYSD
ncbi:hypothetical protein KJ632_01525 [Patescibacteria group bacterium]|nr:hypothetical protein [Patescibacteria group bacterium]